LVATFSRAKERKSFVEDFVKRLKFIGTALEEEINKLASERDREA